MVATNGHSRVHVIEDRLHHLVDKLRTVENDQVSRVRRLLMRTRARIEAHPIAAAAAFFAVSYVVARIGRRKP